MIPRGIVVLGMHRGGTSLAAHLVSCWGAYGNESAMIGRDDNNPDGHWEYAPLMVFNEELLAAVDSSWVVPPRDSQKELLQSLAEEPEFRDRALSLAAAMRAPGRPWFWKDPRLSILLPFWKQLWGSVAYIVATRDPAAIARSLETRDGLSTLTSFRLWHRYLSEIMSDDELRSTAFFASYELFLEQPSVECARLCHFLDGCCQVETPEQDGRLQAMADAVKPSLWRSRARPFAAHPLASRAQKDLYAATLSAELRQNSQPGTAGLDPSWREDLALAERSRQLDAPNLCQMFWRNPAGDYLEMRSAWKPVRPGAGPQSIQLPLPPGQAEGRLYLRLDVSRRPGFLRLLSLELESADSAMVWRWDGSADSLQHLTSNQIEWCAGSRTERGCLLRLVGDDPWLEIQLAPAESAAVAGGACLTMNAIFLSTEAALVETQLEIADLRRELDELRLRAADPERLGAGK